MTENEFWWVKARLGMRFWWSSLICVFVFTLVANAQITRTATFENYAAGTDLGTSFTDPLSGISFSNPTSTNDKFGIGSAPPVPGFASGNYLTNGPGGLAAYFGFIANLPLSANQIMLEVAWIGTPPGSSGIMLKGFSSINASGTLITQQSLANEPDPYILSISSTQYDIESFQVVISGGEGTAYDNINYTYLPEPTSVSILFIGLGLLGQRRYRW